jgi:hypothetical protein
MEFETSCRDAGRSRQVFFALQVRWPVNFPSPPGSAVLAMVQVEIWSLTLASVKAVGSIAVMAAGGELWRMDIFFVDSNHPRNRCSIIYKVDSLSLYVKFNHDCKL